MALSGKVMTFLVTSFKALQQAALKCNCELFTVRDNRIRVQSLTYSMYVTLVHCYIFQFILLCYLSIEQCRKILFFASIFKGTDLVIEISRNETLVQTIISHYHHSRGDRYYVARINHDTRWYQNVFNIRMTQWPARVSFS